jgi:hypothetical protein
VCELGWHSIIFETSSFNAVQRAWLTEIMQRARTDFNLHRAIQATKSELVLTKAARLCEPNSGSFLLLRPRDARERGFELSGQPIHLQQRVQPLEIAMRLS